MKLKEQSRDFIGRDKELAQLRQTFTSSKQNNPQFSVIQADTGIGKTRLIQELYHDLTISDDPTHYWPDNLKDTKHTMTIVPEFDSLATTKELETPWLWLAIRCPNQDERNSSFYGSALSQLKKQIQMHLGALIEAKKKRTDHIKLIKSSITLLANYAFPGTGAAIGLIAKLFDALEQGISTQDSLRNLHDYWQGRKVLGNDRLLNAKKEEYHSLVDQTLDVFSALFAEGGRIPVILVVDDAHWADPLTLQFLQKLLDQSYEQNWPIFVLATCWESTLKEQQQEIVLDSQNRPFISSFGSLVAYSESMFLDNYPRAQTVELEKLSEQQIQQVIELEFGNFDEEAKNLLATNCSGDLELLWDLMKRLKNMPGYLDKEGKLQVPIQKIKFHSSRKKELVREKIFELGSGMACMISWGVHRVLNFPKRLLINVAKLL